MVLYIVNWVSRWFANTSVLALGESTVDHEQDRLVLRGQIGILNRPVTQIHGRFVKALKVSDQSLDV